MPAVTLHHRMPGSSADVTCAKFDWCIGSERIELVGEGNGPISAVVRALKDSGKLPFFKVEDFSERTLGTDADARALAFVGLRCSADGKKLIYGAGEDTNIDRAAIMAVVSAFNRAHSLGVFGA